ncbi:MAG TPA: hypothetical protein P5571_10935 [Candidatus Krumholzibacteria bacterium]|nr:hypothetical protein [Candidatus Krumholzibacteria bacterium]HRX51870.1 hypothetical protein [Candidatus Krumholzibacteria bacterium]
MSDPTRIIRRAAARLSRRPSLGVAVGAYGLHLLLLLLCRPFTPDGVHYQPWTSDRLMQTVALEDLRASPWDSLDHLHIHPPALDLARALLARLTPHAAPDTALRFVDGGLLLLWGLFYALAGGLAYRWAREAAGPRMGLLTAAAVLLHPATIFYASTLDTTLPTAALTLALLYLLTRARDGRLRTALLLAGAYLLLFFTRALYQWPFPFLLAGSLLLLRAPRRTVLTFLVTTVLISGLHVEKQHARFGTWFTSTLSGFNLVRSVGIDDTEGYLHLMDARAATPGPTGDGPAVLTRAFIAPGVPNYNHADYLAENHRLLDVYHAHLKTLPLGDLLRDYAFNLWLYVQPSSRYTRHAVVDRLPWRKAADRLASFPAGLLPLGLAGLAWGAALRRGGRRTAAALALPVGAVFLLSVLCEQGENMRYRFFLEPAAVVFVGVWAPRSRALIRSWRRRPDPAAPPAPRPAAAPDPAPRAAEAEA